MEKRGSFLSVFILTLFYLVANLTSALLSGYMELDGGWIAPFNGYQCKATSTSQAWNASRILCQNLGGDFAQYGVRDVGTRRTLYRGLSLNGDYWIGLSDIETDGTWLWLNGNQANTNDGSMWYTDNPSTDRENEDCASVYFMESIAGLFVWDGPCVASYQALCEKTV